MAVLRNLRRARRAKHATLTLRDMSQSKPNAFVVTAVRTGTCIACEKETQVFDVVHQQQAMALCPKDFFKQVKIAGAASSSSPLAAESRTAS